MPVTRADVRSAYRYLLRSMAIAFQEDHATLNAARIEARRRFNDGNKSLNADSAEALQAVKEARDAGKFLRKNLVQGVKDEENGNFRKSYILVGVMVGLQIHDEIERGDNASIKTPPPIPMPERKSRRKKTQL
jgi:hypothetical protein